VEAISRVLNHAFVGAIIWATAGIATAAVVSMLALFTWAILLFVYAMPAAIALGAIHGVWMGRWPSVAGTRAERSGWMTGAAMGALGFMPTYSLTNGFNSYWFVAVFLAAALIGGAVAGGVTGAILRPSLGEARQSRRSRLAAMALVAAAALQVAILGPPVGRRLPVRPVTEDEVRIPPGTARGEATLCFHYEGHADPISAVGVTGGRADFAARDGALVVVLGLDAPYTGGLDQDGSFRVGRETTAPDGTRFRAVIEGELESPTRYRYIRRATVERDGRLVNSTRERGSGVKCE